MNKCSGNTQELLGTGQNQVGVVVTTDTILEQPTVPVSDGAQCKVGSPEPDTPGHKRGNVKPLLD